MPRCDRQSHDNIDLRLMARADAWNRGWEQAKREYSLAEDSGRAFEGYPVPFPEGTQEFIGYSQFLAAIESGED